MKRGNTVSGNFAAGTVYKAEITVGTSSDLYKLASNPTVTVNGKTTGSDSYTIAYAGGVVTVTFPATAAAEA